MCCFNLIETRARDKDINSQRAMRLLCYDESLDSSLPLVNTGIVVESPSTLDAEEDH